MTPITITETRPEMGAPYPVERGGIQMDPHTIVHPEWPPRAPRELAQGVVDRARACERMLNNYFRRSA